MYKLLVSILGILFEGFVLSKLWNWFAAPYFHLDPIRWIAMSGLSLMAALVVYRSSTKEITDEEFSDMMYQNVGANLFVLLFGYILHLFL